MTNKRPKFKIVGVEHLQESAILHEAFVVGVSTALASYNGRHESGLPLHPGEIASTAAHSILQDLLTADAGQSIASSEDVDPDDFLDYARAEVQNNNKPYDAASFKDFESLLEESIRSHFLDDDDEDSMTSASSFSGYDHEAHPKKHLENNALISQLSSSRLNGTIARRKSKEHPSSKSDNDTLSSSSSASRDMDEGGSSDESTVATGTCKPPRSKLMKADPKTYLRRYSICDENSLVSDNSYQPGRVRRRRTRIRKRGRCKTDSSVDTENAWDNVEQTADDLAFVFMQEWLQHRESTVSFLNENNKDAILSSLKQKSPALYDIVSSQMESRDGLTATPPICGSEQLNASQGDVTNVSNCSAPLHRSIKIACATPDKTYEADKSQLESTLDDDQVGLSAMDSKDLIDISESSSNQSPANRKLVPLESSDATFTSDSTLAIDYLDAAQDEPSVDTSCLNISVDSGNLFLPSIEEVDNDLATIVESPENQDGWDLDEMIELFLNHKIERLKERMVERQMTLSRRADLVKELKKRNDSLMHKEQQQSQTYVPAKSDLQSVETASVVRPAGSGTEQLKGFRSRSYWHARVRDSAESMTQQSISRHEKSIGKEGDSLTNYQGDSVQNSSCIKGHELIRRVQSKRETIAKARKDKDDTGSFDRTFSNEVTGPTVQKQLNGFMHRKPLPIDAKKKRLRNLKARRRSILRSQKLRQDEMLHPLQAPIDDLDECIPQVTSSSGAPPVKKSLRFGRLRIDSSYEALPEKENSFATVDMNSQDILQAFVPPSPESPIRDYRVPNLTDTDTSDAVHSEDADSSSLQFATGASHGNNFSDSFDEIVLRTTPKNIIIPGWVAGRQEESPTGVDGFFDVFEPIRKPKPVTSSLAFVDEEEPDPVFVDDDEFNQESSYQIESGLMTGQVEPSFFSSNRFEI